MGVGANVLILPVLLITEFKRQVVAVQRWRGVGNDGQVDGSFNTLHFADDAADLQFHAGAPADHHLFRFVLLVRAERDTQIKSNQFRRGDWRLAYWWATHFDAIGNGRDDLLGQRQDPSVLLDARQRWQVLLMEVDRVDALPPDTAGSAADRSDATTWGRAPINHRPGVGAIKAKERNQKDNIKTHRSRNETEILARPPMRNVKQLVFHWRQHRWTASVERPEMKWNKWQQRTNSSHVENNNKRRSKKPLII